MKILKASAGSGKTYRLSRTYIRLLMESEDRYAYRHILAVTFTNKATAEMKARILKDLYELSADNPKAKRILKDILHDYSAFSVSNIDKFFQRALKSFSREIGQYSDYQIELDRKALINEAMDRMLDSITDDQQVLVKWIKDSMVDCIESGQAFRLDKALYDMGLRLKSEEHRKLAEEYGVNDMEAYSKERLDSIRDICRKVISDFRVRAEAMGVKANDAGFFKMPGKRALAASAELADLFDGPYKDYCTARIISGNIFTLGLAGEFYRNFDALLKEKNVMCLDESNTILRDIIDGSDAPFVYEKMGVRYDHFLLDEFQDTSMIQWDNFLPLLKNSEASAAADANLIVGDVKQSIYRWRDSDWRLLAENVPAEFPGAEKESMQENWRSCRQIVDFNNRFFEWLSARMGLAGMYGDVRQTPRDKDPQTGTVKASFCEDQLDAVLNSVRSAEEAGAMWGDIAILVRDKKHGKAVAGHLINVGIPVISDDSLTIKSSPLVRRIVSMLSLMDNPKDKIHSYMAGCGTDSLPGSHHSLTDLAESLFRELAAREGADVEGESVYVQAFMDDLRSWVDIYGNNLRYYLKHWAETDPCISSPEVSTSIRIMTIHKSKGLQFPYVIIPFAETIDMYDPDVHWCHLETAGTGLPAELEGIYPVNLSSLTGNTRFSDDYEKERAAQIVDNANLLYVAMTRAERVLHVIAGMPSKTCRESLGKSNPHYGNFSELLYDYVGRFEEYVTGDPYDFSRMARKDSSRELDYESSYKSFPLGERLKPSEDAADFFGDDGTSGTAASTRLKGIVMHDILSAVQTAGDLQAAVDDAVLDGRLTASEASEAFGILSAGIASHPGWFEGRCINERPVFDAYGNERRPDRVVVGDGKTVIIDFKFGREEERYARQVSKYMSVYDRMGFPNVEGWIWYVLENKSVRV